MAKTVAFIPARGGSKGIPHKNIVNLAGKPLITYSILAAKNCRFIDSIYTSSDDEKILSVAAQAGSELILRSTDLAQDTTPTNPVITEFIKELGLTDDDIIVVLQPTSPLRKTSHIAEAITLFKSHPEARGLISVYVADNKYFYAYSGANPYLTPLMPEAFKVSRRQDLPSIYLPNGALYIFSVAEFMKEQKVPQTQVVAFVMSLEDSVDIDTPDDLLRAELLLNRSSEE